MISWFIYKMSGFFYLQGCGTFGYLLCLAKYPLNAIIYVTAAIVIGLLNCFWAASVDRLSALITT